MRQLALFFMMFICCLLDAQQDCISAIPICQDTFIEANSWQGVGELEDFKFGQTCLFQEQNSVWYEFHANGTGQLGFLITPNDPDDDYDWALFDLTGVDCTEFSNDPNSFVVSCNAAGGGSCNGATGADGSSEFDIQGANCGNAIPDLTRGKNPFNAFIEVKEGHDYYLVVNNWNWGDNRGGGSGYTIDFSLRNVSIFDDIRPYVVDLEFNNNCNFNELYIVFSEPINCQTFDNSNFIVRNPSRIYETELIVEDCDFTDRVTLIINDPEFDLGKYEFQLRVDGQTQALDWCENPSEINSYFFDNPVANLFANLGPNKIICNKDSVELDPGFFIADYIWSTGETTPRINVDQPGLYSVTITDNCSSTVDEVLVELFDIELNVELGQGYVLCAGQSVILDVTNENAEYNWSDGDNSPVKTVVDPGIYSVTVTNECGSIADTIRFSGPENIGILDIGRDTTICPGEKLVLRTGLQGQHVWSTGETSSSITTTDPGLYAVTVSNTCFEAMSEILISHKDSIDVQIEEFGQLCNGSSVIVRAFGNATDYDWSTGDKAIFTNINKPGQYFLTASNTCGEITIPFKVTNCSKKSKVYIPNAISPNGDGNNDIWRVQVGNEIEVINFEAKVFNRWGGLVWETNTYGPGWEPKDDFFSNKGDFNPAVFAFTVKIHMKDENGTESENVYVGEVTLIK